MADFNFVGDFGNKPSYQPLVAINLDGSAVVFAGKQSPLINLVTNTSRMPDRIQDLRPESSGYTTPRDVPLADAVR